MRARERESEPGNKSIDLLLVGPGELMTKVGGLGGHGLEALSWLDKKCLGIEVEGEESRAPPASKDGDDPGWVLSLVGRFVDDNGGSVTLASLKEKLPQITASLLMESGSFDVDEDAQGKVSRRTGGGQHNAEAPGPSVPTSSGGGRGARGSKNEWEGQEWSHWRPGGAPPTDDEKMQLRSYVNGRNMLEGLYEAGPGGAARHDVAVAGIKKLQNYAPFAKTQWYNYTRSLGPPGSREGKVYDPLAHAPWDCARFLEKVAGGFTYKEDGTEVPPTPLAAGKGTAPGGGWEQSSGRSTRGWAPGGIDALALETSRQHAATLSRWDGGGKSWHSASAGSAAQAIGWYGPGQWQTGKGGTGAQWKGEFGPEAGSWKGDYGQKGGYQGGGSSSSSKGTPGGQGKGVHDSDDWVCPQCGEINFKRRMCCRKCRHAARPGSGGDFGLPEGQWCIP